MKINFISTGTKLKYSEFFKTEIVTKSHNARKMGRGDSYCSISLECQESGYEKFISYKADAKVDTCI